MREPEAPPRADRLTTQLQRFPLQTGVFHAGGLCGVHDFFAAGFEERHVLHIVLALAVKSLSNYSNHAYATPSIPSSRPTRSRRRPDFAEVH